MRNLYNIGCDISYIMYVYYQNNLLLRRMVVALMVSLTKPSSTAVPALDITVLGCVATLVATVLTAEIAHFSINYFEQPNKGVGNGGLCSWS